MVSELIIGLYSSHEIVVTLCWIPCVSWPLVFRAVTAHLQTKTKKHSPCKAMGNFRYTIIIGGLRRTTHAVDSKAFSLISFQLQSLFYIFRNLTYPYRCIIPMRNMQRTSTGDITTKFVATDRLLTFINKCLYSQCETKRVCCKCFAVKTI